MTEVFAVFKVGVYRHACGGVFSTLDAAKAAADKFLAGESDRHHYYEVVRFVLDLPTTQTPVESRWSGGELIEDEPVYVSGSYR